MDESQCSMDAFEWAIQNLIKRSTSTDSAPTTISTTGVSTTTPSSPSSSTSLIVIARVIEEKEVLDLFYGEEEGKI